MKHRYGRVYMMLHPLFFTDFLANINLVMADHTGARLGIDGCKGSIRHKVAANQAGNHHEKEDGDIAFCQTKFDHHCILLAGTCMDGRCSKPPNGSKLNFHFNKTIPIEEVTVCHGSQ